MENATSIILTKIDPQQLPAIPKVLLTLIEAFQNRKTDFDELSKIIWQDAGLSSKIVAAANSPFYAQFGELKDLNRVLVVLGLDVLKTIAMTSVVHHFFSQIPASHQKHLEAIWYRSLACAHFARRLAKLSGYESPDQAYLSGLLHRIGQLGMLQFFPKEYSALLNEYSDDVSEIHERESFGITQSEVGAHIIDSWHIPGFMADAVLYQNKSSEAILDSSALVKLINLSAQLSRFDRESNYSVLAETYAYLGLSQALLEEIANEVKIQVEQTANSLGIAVMKPEDDASTIKAKLEERNATQKRLNEHAKELAFRGALSNHEDRNLQFDKILEFLLRDLNILFGLRSGAVFLVNRESHTLVGYDISSQKGQERWSDLSIELKPYRSLLVNALLKKRVFDSYQTPQPEPVPVIDGQICRLLATEGMAAIPLYANKRHWGVIAAGLPFADRLKFRAKRGLISIFAGEAAQMLSDSRQAGEGIKESTDAVRADFRLHAKKVIHEANNPLSIVNNYLYLLNKKIGSESSQEIELIQEEINRVGEIILRLSDLPEHDESIDESGPIDINQTIIDLIALFEGGLLATRQITADVDLDEQLPKIVVNKPKLKQILINLIKNAAEALPSSGRVTISTRDRIYLGNQCTAVIQIQDDGPGLPETIRENLFHPVVSTKGEGHAGLGLTIVKNLVDELAGTIGCTTSPEKGTTFRIFLPRKV